MYRGNIHMRQLSSGPGRIGQLTRSACFFYIVCMMLIAGLLVATSPAEAAPLTQTTAPNVKLTARSLFQGWFKYGDWLPIEVNLENFGEAVTVKVAASINTSGSSAKYTTNYQ